MDPKGIVAVGVHSINVVLIRMAAEPDCPFSRIVTIGHFLSVAGQFYSKVPSMPRALWWLNTHAPWAAEIVGIQGCRPLVKNGVD